MTAAVALAETHPQHRIRLVAVAVGLLVARHFARTGWPLHRANFWLVALAALIFLAAYAAKAGAGSTSSVAVSARRLDARCCGRRSFRRAGSRCRPLRRGDSRCVSGAAGAKRASIGAVALSLFLLVCSTAPRWRRSRRSRSPSQHIGGWMQGRLVVVASGSGVADSCCRCRASRGSSGCSGSAGALDRRERDAASRRRVGLGRRGDLVAAALARHVRPPRRPRARRRLCACPRVRLCSVSGGSAAGRSGRSRDAGGSRGRHPRRSGMHADEAVAFAIARRRSLIAAARPACSGSPPGIARAVLLPSLSRRAADPSPTSASVAPGRACLRARAGRARRAMSACGRDRELPGCLTRRRGRRSRAARGARRVGARLRLECADREVAPRRPSRRCDSRQRRR